MGLGQVLAGITYTIVICLSLPEMVDGVKAHYPGQEREVSNLSSGIFILTNGIGQFIGPIYGSFVEERIGFKHTTTATAFLNIAFAIAYFLSAGGIEAIKST